MQSSPPWAAEAAFVTGYSRRTAPAGVDPLDPIDRLALRLAELCSEAFDPLAIVAGLEAEGHNDRLAQEQHGLPDLFALAEELYRRVPRAGLARDDAAPGRGPGRSADSMTRPLLRGLLFTVPALCGLALLPAAGQTGTAVRLGMAAIQVVAWGYGQGTAHAAYARLNAGDQPAARGLLRRATLCALAGEVGLFVLLTLMTGCAPGLLLPTATALGYCLAAVPALVLGGELKLAAVLAPVGLAALARAAGLPANWGGAGVAVVAAVTVIGTLWLAMRLTRPPERSGARSARLRLGPELLLRMGPAARARISARTRLRRLIHLRRARISRLINFGRARAHAAPRQPWATGPMPQALYGSCIGIWLLLVLVGPVHTGSAGRLHAAAALTLSMGAAEWHYAWFRQAMRRSLAANHELGGFARRAILVLSLALGRQALTTAVLAGLFYTLLDGHSGGLDFYLFTLALSPGLLAATVVRTIAARGLLMLTASAVATTAIVEPHGGSAVVALVAVAYALALAVAAARMSTRPWGSL